MEFVSYVHVVSYISFRRSGIRIARISHTTSTQAQRNQDGSRRRTQTVKHSNTIWANITQLISAKTGVANQQNLDGKIRCAHLLVKHRDSRRPSSWREAEITRSKDDAMNIIRGHEQRIKSGSTSLGDLATTESDCSSARKRGDL